MCSSSSERWEAAYTRLLMPSRSFPFYCSSGRNVVWGSPSAFLCPIDQGLKYQFRANPYIDAAICFRSDDLFRDLLRKLPLHGLRRRYIHGGTNNEKTNIREKHYCCLKYFMMMKPYFHCCIFIQQCIKQTKKKSDFFAKVSVFTCLQQFHCPLLLPHEVAQIKFARSLNNERLLYSHISS